MFAGERGGGCWLGGSKVGMDGWLCGLMLPHKVWEKRKASQSETAMRIQHRQRTNTASRRVYILNSYCYYQVSIPSLRKSEISLYIQHIQSRAIPNDLESPGYSKPRAYIDLENLVIQ